HAPTHVAANLRTRMRVAPAGRSRRAGCLARRHRIQVEHQPAIESLETVERTRLRKERRVRAFGRGPGILIAGMLHLTDDIDVPALHVDRLVFETLERNAELDLVAILRQPSLGRVYEVLTQIRRGTPGQRRRPAAGRNTGFDD